MKLTVEVSLDSAAFHVQSNDEDYGSFAPGEELADILGVLGETLRVPALRAGDNGSLRDVNGNTVLHWRITDDAPIE